jgi:hypothetical protein
MTAGKVAALERLAADPAAAPGERDNALRAAKRLRARAPSSAAHHWPPAPPPPRGRAESRGNVHCWVGPPPAHGPVCRAGFGGCPECAELEAFRRWLRGVR